MPGFVKHPTKIKNHINVSPPKKTNKQRSHCYNCFVLAKCCFPTGIRIIYMSEISTGKIGWNYVRNFLARHVFTFCTLKIKDISSSVWNVRKQCACIHTKYLEKPSRYHCELTGGRHLEFSACSTDLVYLPLHSKGTNFTAKITIIIILRILAPPL